MISTRKPSAALTPMTWAVPLAVAMALLTHHGVHSDSSSEATQDWCGDLQIAFRKHDCFDDASTHICRQLKKELKKEHASKCNPCLLEPCQNGGTCSWTSSTAYSCACPPGPSGTDCRATLCELGVCQNGATCTLEGDSYTCQCADGFFGDTCLEPSSTCVPPNYLVIDDPSRLPDNVVSDGYNFDDDINTVAWYRFKLDGDNAVIASRPPQCYPSGACGTQVPFILSTSVGSLEPGDPVTTRSICNPINSAPTPACTCNGIISAYRCSTFTILRLVSHSNGAYCVVLEGE